MGKSIAKRAEAISFGWYGGKYSHLDWLLPLLPPSQHFCDVFGGSAAVIINRPPSPVETYNDIHSEVVNFFRVLRDQKEQLIEAIGLTPFSREKLGLASQRQTEGITELERARRFFVCARQVRTGLAQTSSAGRWAHCLLTSRAGMSGVVSRWLGSIDDLSLIAQRLLRVQIENAPAIDVIEIDLNTITEPIVAAPNDPDNIKLLSEVAGAKIDEVFVGSCMTNKSSVVDGRIVFEHSGFLDGIRSTI
jgi:DNA adenine methylase